MTPSLQILSELVIYNKYSRFLPESNTRENWEQITDRTYRMLFDQIIAKADGKEHKDLIHSLDTACKSIAQKEILPSMRCLQFAGNAIKAENARMYNCAFLPITEIKNIADLAYLSMCGCGVGFSVQKKHVNHFPTFMQLKKGTIVFPIADTAAGWADAIKALLENYLISGVDNFEFDYSRIRKAGTPLITSGGYAPGPGPLKKCLEAITRILKIHAPGDSLRPIHIHDMICHISEAVLSGGVRRSALISLFDYDDTDMLYAKTDGWFRYHPQRARCNNSAVLDRKKITRADFEDIIRLTVAGGYGEPGIFWGYDNNNGTNPCAEIGLESFQFCNLTEINLQAVKENKDFSRLCKDAAFLATLQATFTDFNYINDYWKVKTEKDALIGVGITGVCGQRIQDIELLDAGARIVRAVNKETAKKMGINQSPRCTTVKPAGTTSCVFGTSSGIHPWHDEYFLRRIQINKNSGLYKYLLNTNPEIIHAYNATDSTVCLPIKAPKNALFRKDMSFRKLFDLVLKYQLYWVRPGQNSLKHINNNVSCTLSYRPEEVDSMINTLWEERFNYTAVSLLPLDTNKYQNPPFESIKQEEYELLIAKVRPINFEKINESGDVINHGLESACTGGQCELI